MKKRYLLVSFCILLTAAILAACAPEVRIENAPPTLPITPATTAVSPSTTQSGQTTGPAATSLAATIPGTTTTEGRPTAETTSPRPNTPVVVLESDEIVPIPATLLMDLNKTLDELLVSIGQLEAPDDDVLVFP